MLTTFLGFVDAVLSLFFRAFKKVLIYALLLAFIGAAFVTSVILLGYEIVVR